MSFFAIKLKDFDVWLGKKNLSYFIRDDGYFNLTKSKVDSILYFGVAEKRKRIFSSTDQVRRSLRSCNKETIVTTIPPSASMLSLTVLVKGDSLGKFSNYFVLDLTNNKTYSLNDVINGLV